MTPAEERIEGKTGLKIFLRNWRPTTPARGAVVICHGFNAHSGQYLWVADQLSAQGLVVYAFDLRGRGQSDGERFYVDDFSEYADDVDSVVQLAKAREPKLPIYLLGHSAGGVTACLYALDHQSDLAGLICESFAYQLPAPDFALAALKGLSHLAPHAHVLALSNADFSRDKAVVKAMNEDPLIAHETQPTRTVAALARADDKLKTAFAKITLPVFILHGTADKAAKFQGSQFFFDQAGAKDKTLKLYDGHYHDMLNDLGKEEVMSDISIWITSRLLKSA